MKNFNFDEFKARLELVTLCTIFLFTLIAVSPPVWEIKMAWLDKAKLDLSNAQFESKENISRTVREFVIENSWNTPFIIKTGTNVTVKTQVTEVLDSITFYTKWDDDEIEILQLWQNSAKKTF